MWSNIGGLASEHAQGIGRIRRDFLANVAHLDDPLALEAQDVDDRDLAGRLLALQVRQGSHPVLRFDRLLDLERLVRLAGRALLHRLEQRLAVLREPWVVVAEVLGDEAVVGLADAAPGAQGEEFGGDFGFGASGHGFLTYAPASIHRAAAAAVSSGLVLNAMNAPGADLCAVFTRVSKSSKLFGGMRIPPPIPTQS